MQPRLLRAFVAVAEELHFGRAAQRLHMAQPPLSMQIRRLEEELEVALFTRSKRHVALTEAGRALLGRARHLLAEADRAAAEVQRIARGEAGALAIGYTPTASYELLPRLVPAYRAQHPAVRLELFELRSALQPDALREGRIEVGLVCAPVASAGLVEHVLAREEPLVVLPTRHPLARRKRIPVQALDGAACVLVKREIEPGWADACAQALHRAGVRLRTVQETDTKIALLGLVAAGLGLSIVSRSMARLGRQGVVFRPLSGLRLRFPLALLSRPESSARAAGFIELARHS